MAQWILSCKELNGRVYVSRLPKTIPPAGPDDLPKPGIPSAWVYVGPGLRPTIQHYSGNANSFLLSFEYLSHLVCRVIPDIDATWPPTVVDPVTFSPTSIELPEEAIAVKLDSATIRGDASYYFNPILLVTPSLFYNPFTDTFSVTITAQGGWIPIISSVITPYYRVYRRPLIGGPWVLIMDWNTTLNYTDSQVGGPFQYEYTATWGALFNPSNPNVTTDHNEGIIGDGTVLSVDSNTAAFDYAVPADDSLVVGSQQNAFLYAEANQLYFVQTPDDEISIQKARLEDSSLALCNASEFIAFQVTTGDDQEQFPAGAAYPQANAAPAGMFS